MLTVISPSSASSIGLPSGVPPTKLIWGAYWTFIFVNVVGDVFSGVVVSIFHFLFALEGVGFHYLFYGFDFVVFLKPMPLMVGMPGMPDGGAID